MAEISTAGVGFLLVPVIGQIDLRLAGGGGEENQSEPARLNLLSSGFHQPKGFLRAVNYALVIVIAGYLSDDRLEMR
jgi:hypothetical protein